MRNLKSPIGFMISVLNKEVTGYLERSKRRIEMRMIFDYIFKG